jgi:hypothetical protein
MMMMMVTATTAYTSTSTAAIWEAAPGEGIRSSHRRVVVSTIMHCHYSNT